VRGGKTELLEGSPDPRASSSSSSPDAAAAKHWYNSPNIRRH